MTLHENYFDDCRELIRRVLRKRHAPLRILSWSCPTTSASRGARPSIRARRGSRIRRLGLAGEAGEVAEHVKKVLRDDGGEVGPERRAAMSKELGDVLWYVAQLASELDLDLDEIARENLDKLFSRQRRGVLSGSGDDR